MGSWGSSTEACISTRLSDADATDVSGLSVAPSSYLRGATGAEGGLSRLAPNLRLNTLLLIACLSEFVAELVAEKVEEVTEGSLLP